MVVRRGEIWWANLGKPRRSEPGYSRPVLIISADSFNASNISTVTIAILTSNVKLAAVPGNVSLTPAQSGLPKPSIVNVSQLMTLDKSFLTKRVQRLPAGLISQIDRGLRLALELP